MKKFGVSFWFIAAYLLVCFPMMAQATPPYVGDCLGEDPTSECLEEEESIDTGEANQDEKEVLSEEMSTGSIVFQVIKTLFALLLILALIYILIKFLSKRNKLFNQVKALENLGGISVGQNKSIQIVRIGNKVFMVGVGDNVELLQEIDDEDLVKDLILNNEQGDFQVNHLVQSIFKPKSGDNDEPQQKFKKLFSNELEKLKDNRLNVRNQQKKKED